jgi:hypothetical protein
MSLVTLIVLLAVLRFRLVLQRAAAVVHEHEDSNSVQQRLYKYAGKHHQNAYAIHRH